MCKELFDEDYLRSIKVSEKSPLYRLKILLATQPNYRKFYQRKIRDTCNILIRELQIKNGRFLDFGCGGGWLSVGVAKETNCKTIGFDLSEDLIRFSIARAKHEKTRSHFLISAGENLPFKDETFNYIAAIDVLEHVKDFRKCIQEMMRVLKKGRIYFVVPNKFAFYCPGHSNIKTQLKKLILHICGKEANFPTHGDTGYERLFTYFKLKNELNELKLNYRLIRPKKDRLWIKVVTFLKLDLMLGPSFAVVIEK